MEEEASPTSRAEDSVQWLNNQMAIEFDTPEVSLHSKSLKRQGFQKRPEGSEALQALDKPTSSSNSQINKGTEWQSRPGVETVDATSTESGRERGAEGETPDPHTAESPITGTGNSQSRFQRRPSSGLNVVSRLSIGTGRDLSRQVRCTKSTI